MKSLILLAVALLAAVLVGYFALRGTEDDRGAPSPEEVTAPDTKTEQESRPDTLDPPPGRNDATEEGSGDDPATTSGTTQPETESPGKPDAQAVLAQRDWELLVQSFEDRHGHLTLGELRIALSQVEEVISEQQKILFEDRFSRGIYEVQVLGAPPISPHVPDARGRMPLQDTRTATDPATMQIEAHIATLPFDEFLDLYQLLDERDWLRQQIGD